MSISITRQSVVKSRFSMTGIQRKAKKSFAMVKHRAALGSAIKYVMS